MTPTTEFLSKYKSEDYLFNQTNYRKGARITCSFGLTEGYRIINGKYFWDSIRLHSGVDRSGKYNSRGQNLKENVVIAPFDFNRCTVKDYGPDHVYKEAYEFTKAKTGWGYEKRRKCTHI